MAHLLAVSYPAFTVFPASINILKTMQLRCMVYLDLIFSATNSLTSNTLAIWHNVFNRQTTSRLQTAKLVFVLSYIANNPPFSGSKNWDVPLSSFFTALLHNI